MHSKPCYLHSQWLWQGQAAARGAVGTVCVSVSIDSAFTLEEGETMTPAAVCRLLAGRLLGRVGPARVWAPCTWVHSQAATTNPVGMMGALGCR